MERSPSSTNVNTNTNTNTNSSLTNVNGIVGIFRNRVLGWINIGSNDNSHTLTLPKNSESIMTTTSNGTSNPTTNNANTNTNHDSSGSGNGSSNQLHTRNDLDQIHNDESPTPPTTTTNNDPTMMIKVPKGTIQYRWKVIRWTALVVVIFFIGSIVSFTISMNHQQEQENEGGDSSFDPTSPRSTVAIETKREMYRTYRNILIQEIESIDPTISQLLVVPSSTEWKALQWLLRHDDITIQSFVNQMKTNTDGSLIFDGLDHTLLIQRFAIVTIYIHFHLVPIMNPTQHECQWMGITCNTKDITAINITSLLSSFFNQSDDTSATDTGITTSPNNTTSSQLIGPIFGTTIPVALSYVSNTLTTLDLSYLQMVGTIPYACYEQWDQLIYLNLEQNQLNQFFTLPKSTRTKNTATPITSWWPSIQYINVGNNILQESVLHFNNNYNNNTIDNITTTSTKTTTTSITKWNQLRHLILIGNNDLTGPLLQYGLQHWPLIETIEISETSITGTIPDHTTTNVSVLNLKTLAAYRVPLSGSLPSILGIMATNLEILALGLSDMIWTGSLPESYSSFTSLKILSLSHLNGITGTLPSSWGTNMTNLESMDLFGNPDLVGSIPSSWGRMTNLAVLRLAQTGISGTIPSELGQLTDLVDASFHRTNLMGSVPQEICQLRNAPYILSKLSVDCIANTISDSNQQPPVTCSKPDCCTSCT